MFKSRRSVYDETRNTNCTEMDNNQRTTNDHSKAWTVITQLHLTWHEWSRWTTTRPNLGRQYCALIYRGTLEHQTTLEWIRYCKYVIFLFNKTHYFSNPTQQGSVYKLVSSCVVTTITCIMITSSANLHNTNFKQIASKHIQYQTNWHMTRSSQSYKLPWYYTDTWSTYHQIQLHFCYHTQRDVNKIERSQIKYCQIIRKNIRTSDLDTHDTLQHST